MLERRYKDKLDQDANDFIKYAVDGANRMQKLINDLLDYSRTTSRGKDFAKVDISQVLGQTISKTEEDILKTYNLHANCYITKPLDFNKFIEVVKSIEDFWLSVVKLPNH